MNYGDYIYFGGKGMRRFALFLPQYHEIPENNKWWGNGFTEWKNVERGIPFFNGHIQPKRPLNNNYYNLLNKETVKWQTKLIKKYKIDGFVYYHYYFCGKKLLEKPAENLLLWQDIHQPFFFCWANHTWYRSWNNSKEVLIEQTYGKPKDWKQHFDYLLPFFKDERYEKKDNKPIFMIFQSDFKKKNEIIDFFDTQCKKNGFDGIYIIETFLGGNKNHHFDKFMAEISKKTRLIYLREPSVGLASYQQSIKNLPAKILQKLVKMYSIHSKRKRLMPYDGNKLYNQMIHSGIKGSHLAHGVFFEWDNI